MNAPGQRRFRNILLTGLPGVGKSTFGKAYAQMSRTEFVELDTYVERLAGKSVAEIFAQDGEQAFRELEAQCLERLHKRQRCTIALGGGTLTSPRSFALAQELGCVVWLSAPLPVVVERLWPNKDSRPLLADCSSKEQLASRLETLLAERRDTYSAADVVLETTFSSVDTLKIELAWIERCLLNQPRFPAGEAKDAMSSDEIIMRRIPLADASYRSPRERKSGPEIVDKMERLIKAQRHKERSEKAPRADKNTNLLAPQATSVARQSPQPNVEGASKGPSPVPKPRIEVAGPVPQKSAAKANDRESARGPASAPTPIPRSQVVPAASAPTPIPRSQVLPASAPTPIPRSQVVPAASAPTPVSRAKDLPLPVPKAAALPVPRSQQTESKPTPQNQLSEAGPQPKEKV